MCWGWTWFMPQNPLLPVNLAVQVHAQPLRGQIIEQRFERVEIVVAEEGQDRGLPWGAAPLPR